MRIGWTDREKPRSGLALERPTRGSRCGDELRRIILEDADAEINQVSTGEGGGMGEIETDRLSAIIDEFNDLFGGIEWGERDRINRTVTVDIPAAVAKDTKFENARQNSDREYPHVESDKATG